MLKFEAFKSGLKTHLVITVINLFRLFSPGTSYMIAVGFVMFSVLSAPLWKTLYTCSNNNNNYNFVQSKDVSLLLK